MCFLKHVSQGMITILVALCLTQCAVSAQVSKASQRALEQGRTLLEKEDFTAAAKAFSKSVKLDSANAMAHQLLGGIFYREQKWTKARRHLATAWRLDTEQRILPYHLARIAWHMQSYPEAIEYLEAYFGHPVKNPRINAVAEKLSRDARFMMTAPTEDTMEIKRLPNAINSSAPEYLPSLPAAENIMVFTRRVQGQEDFYRSVKRDGYWQEAEPLSELNTPENEGAHCLAADGKLLIFTACARRDGLGSCDLYYSVLRNERWTKPANLGANINSQSWDGQPSLSANGRTLYFSSDRPGGKGGRDLWVSQRTSKGWEKAVNVSALNTKNNEEAPFIHYDGRSLYFMSNGHPGFGGTDLFLSKIYEEGWSLPLNLGAPINTRDDEGALHIDRLGTTGYFARTNLNASTLQIDIFEFPVPTSIRPTAATYVNIQIRDLVTKVPLKGIIEVFDLQQEKTFLKTQTSADGQLLICLNAGVNYGFNVRSAGYAFHSANIDLMGVQARLSPHQIFADLQPLVKDDLPIAAPAIVLQNVFFEYAKATLLSSSFPELRRLWDLLDHQPKLKIEIQGHTDNVGSPEDNLKLSEERAKTVIEYLIKEGIDASRLSYRGFGESKPVASNETEEGRQKNRRTEFIIR